MGEKKTALDLAESIRGMPFATIAQDQVRQILRAIPADIMDIVGEMFGALERIPGECCKCANYFSGKDYESPAKIAKAAIKRAREAGIGEKDD